MSLADELPQETVQAFVDAVGGRKGQQTQLRIKDEAHLRKALAAAIQATPVQAIVPALQVRAVQPGVLGVPLDDPSVPDGWSPEGVLAIFRGEDPAGNRSIFWRQGGDVVLWEMVGMVECCGDALRGQIADARS